MPVEEQEKESKELTYIAIESDKTKEELTEEQAEEPIEPEEMQKSDPQASQIGEMLKTILDKIDKHDQMIESLATKREYAPTPTMSQPTVIVNNSTPTEGFTMQYGKETEGFFAHTEIKRFISVLEKNPDKFKVKISVTKIEE